MYDLETPRVAQEIINRKAKRVLIQLPDGLRPRAFQLTCVLRSLTNAEILLSGDSCYGACDLAVNAADSLDADLIVHYGHSDIFVKTSIPIIYVDARVEYPVEEILETVLSFINDWKVVGLTTTIQHAKQLPEVTETLKKADKIPVLGKSVSGTYEGQILGCDYTAAQAIANQVDGFLFIGAGRFHPLGLASSTGKPVVLVNPYLQTASVLDEKEVMLFAKRRMAAINAAKAASKIGIVVSTKPGQFQLQIAKELRDKLASQGKEAELIVLDEVTAIKLRNFTEAEAFISTACPRIAIDGLADLENPFLSILEAEIMLGNKRWEKSWGISYIERIGKQDISDL